MVQKHDIFMTGVQDQYRVIFPAPQNEEYFDGEYVLKESYDTSALYPFFCAIKNGTKDIKIQLDLSLKGEEHRITVDEGGIKVEYATDEGFYRAVTSVRQLIDYGEGKTVPFAEIHDKPQFKYRGFQVCRTKNRMTLRYLKRLADYLSELKYNSIELWMQNGPEGFVHEKFPEITPHPDDLTPADIREFDRYCHERHLDLIWANNCFGHLYRWFDIDEYKHLEITDGKTRTGSLNIMHPEADEFLIKMFDSILPHLSSEYVHPGLDEAFGLGKFQLEEICKEKGRAQVFVDFINKIEKLIRERYGKKIFFCTDMFMEMENPEKYLQQCPKDAFAPEWGYEEMNLHLVDDYMRIKTESGLKTMIVPCTGSWDAFAGRLTNTINNIRAYAEVGQKYNSYGCTITIWNGEAFVWDIVPAALQAQYAWNVGHKQHGGWTKGYYVRNAQNYVDKYMFGGAKVSKHICRLANTYLLEPEYAACGTILHQMMEKPLSVKVKKDFFDIRELYEEFHIDNIIQYVTKLIDCIKPIDFPELYKREVLADANAIILAAEYMRVRITDKVTREKAEEMKKLSKWIVGEYKAFKAEQGYRDTEHRRVVFFEAREKELDDYIID